MQVKDYLSRYHNTKEKIKLLEKEIEEFIRLANSIPGISFDQLRVDGTKSLKAPFEKWIQKTLENEQKITLMKRKLPIIKGEIIGVINRLDDSKCKRLLIYRYIDWLSWDNIAKNLVYSSSTVRRWHEKALSQIALSEKDKVEQL
jgi:DNA-directed RNA polymerase specialized sigma subunit